MSFFNDAQKDALLTGRYICSKCGARMQFEDEWKTMRNMKLCILPEKKFAENLTKIK